MMKVKIPEAPKHYSKAAVSARQEATVRPSTAHAPSTARSHIPPNERIPSVKKGEMTHADLLLELGGVGRQDDDAAAGVNIDRGREREMCSSPRLHSGLQQKLQDVNSASQHHHFVRNIVDAGTLTPRRLATPPPSIGVLASSPPSKQQPEAPLTPAATIACIPPEQSMTQVQLTRPPTAPQQPTRATKRPSRESRPSSCFASTSQRFVSQLTGVPPVGHYNIRYEVVDAEARALHLPAQCTLPESPPSPSEERKRPTSVGKGASPSHRKSISGSQAEQEAVSNDDVLSVVVETTKSKPPGKPTSAFASKIPQLTSLTPRRTAYRDDVSVGTYNEYSLSTKKSPRTMVVMGKGSPRKGLPIKPSCGAPVSYNVDNGMKIAAKPSHGGRLTCEGTTHAVLEFDRQVGRDVHITDGQKYSTFANPTQETAVHRKKLDRANDPLRDGTSLDYVTVHDPRSDFSTKGYVDFARQSCRSTAANPLLRRETYDGAAVLAPGTTTTITYPDPHQPVPTFDKMHKPDPYRYGSNCRVDVYEYDTKDVVDTHVPTVSFERGGSHSDTRSTFYHKAHEGSHSAGLEPETAREIVGKRIVRTIDLAKYRSREAPRSAKRRPVAPPQASSRVEAVGSTRDGVEFPLFPGDAAVVNQRLKGDPFLGRHISRAERTKRLEPKPVATSDRNYTVELKTVHDDAERARTAPSAATFCRTVSREQKLGGRLGAEYAQHLGPGPWRYNPHLDRHGRPCELSPERRHAPKEEEDTS